MKTIVLLIAILFVLPAGGELEKLQKRFDALEGFSVTFSQMSNGKKGLSGKVFYAKGNKLRMELRNVLIISDGESVWSYNKKQKKITVTALEGTELSLLNLPELIHEYPKNAAVEEKTDNGRTQIFITPKSKNAQYSKAVVSVGGDGLISEIMVNGKNTGESLITFSSYITDKKQPASLFVMDTPEGVEVIDLR